MTAVPELLTEAARAALTKRRRWLRVGIFLGLMSGSIGMGVSLGEYRRRMNDWCTERDEISARLAADDRLRKSGLRL